MIKLRGGGNPFYALLVIAGVAFGLTACAYGVMAFRQARPDSQPLAATDTSLLGVLDHHGGMILGGEIVLLALLTIAAMGTDNFWEKRAERKATQPQTGAPARSDAAAATPQQQQE
jgi:hypothetical protein